MLYLLFLVFSSVFYFNPLLKVILKECLVTRNHSIYNHITPTQLVFAGCVCEGLLVT
jgi:hypothetical protein